MKYLITLLFFFAVHFAAYTQQPAGSNRIDVSLFKDSVYLKDCLIFLDSNNSINTEQALNLNWKKLKEYPVGKFVPRSWVNKTVYLRFNIYNSSDTLEKVIFFPGVSFSSIRVFKTDSNNKVLQQPDLSLKDGYQPMEIKPGEQQTYLVALEFTRTAFNRLVPQIIKSSYLDKYKKNQYFSNTAFLVIGYLFSGIILMMTFFSAANYFLSRKKEFLYNSIYAAFTFLLIFISTYVDKRSGVLVSLFIGYAAFSLLATGTVFYIAFTRKFLDTRKNFPALNKLFLYAEKLFIILWLSFTYLHFFTTNFLLQQQLETTFKILALLLGLVYIVIAMVQKNRFMNYLALGNGILILLSTISLIVLLFPTHENNFLSRSIVYYEVGIAGELMFFLIGLTYKNRKDLIEKTKMDEALKMDAEKQHYETKLAVLSARQNERNRISTDMHDDLGSGITAIRLYSELAKSRMGKDSVPEIEKISFSANELLNNMNAIIWTMNSKNDTLENMMSYIRSYAQEYFENTGVSCRFDIEDNIPNITVSGPMRRNVFLVIKETLNNILKHSKATQVNISFAKTPDGLLLKVHDNGTGIDLANVRRFGNGLLNMKKRMEEMNIDFSIENKNGTLVALHYKTSI